MAEVLPKLLTFEEFIKWLPENTGKRYELHDGIIVEMPQPSGKHEFDLYKTSATKSLGQGLGEESL